MIDYCAAQKCPGRAVYVGDVNTAVGVMGEGVALKMNGGVAIDFRGRLKYCVAADKRNLLSLSLRSYRIKKFKINFNRVIILV